MCLGIPFKILTIEGKEAFGEYNGLKQKFRTDLMDNPLVGDYVMVHAGFAIEKMSQDDAKKTLEVLKALENI